MLLFFVSAVSITQALSATVEQLLPWLAPNTLALGSSYSAFVQTHPDAQNPLLSERPKDGTFNGEMLEGVGTNSPRIYTFAKGELVSIDWTSSVNVAGTLAVVRNALIQAHGQPTIETAARIDSRGSITRIIREVYRPTVDKDCVICLMATSEGVEVAVTNESIQRKHGIKTTRQTYEDGVRAVSAVVQPNEKSSQLVDYLAAERKKAEAPEPDANPKLPTPQPTVPSPTIPAASSSPSTPAANVAQRPLPVVEPKSPVWLWVLGIAVLVVIAAVASKRRK